MTCYTLVKLQKIFCFVTSCCHGVHTMIGWLFNTSYRNCSPVLKTVGMSPVPHLNFIGNWTALVLQVIPCIYQYNPCISVFCVCSPLIHRWFRTLILPRNPTCPTQRPYPRDPIYPNFPTLSTVSTHIVMMSAICVNTNWWPMI